MVSTTTNTSGPLLPSFWYNYDFAFGLATLCMVIATVMVLVTPTSASERLRRQAVAT